MKNRLPGECVVMGTDDLLACCCGWLIANNLKNGKANNAYFQGRRDEARYGRRDYVRYNAKYRPSVEGAAGHGATHQPAPMPLLRMSRD